MGNPFLSPAPMDPRGGFGFDRPLIGDPRIGGDPRIANGGIGIPGLKGGKICLPGTQCDGPHIAGPFGTSACLGNCVPVSHPDALPLDPTKPPPSRKPDTETVIMRKLGLAPKRKRMNYSNQKALRRALRRATGYARQQKSIRKAAGEFAREFGPKTRRARRDVPPGHGHVR